MNPHEHPPNQTPAHRSARFTELVDCVRARCWSEGYVAPHAWVAWLLDLTIDDIAHRTGLSRPDAEQALTLAEALSIADHLVEATRRSAGEGSAGSGAGGPGDADADVGLRHGPGSSI